jgi:AbrB family looped-hinge helix DNA binding protein
MMHDHSPIHNPCTIHLGNRGRIVLPVEVRQRLDLKEGDRLILTIEPDGSLRLVSAREVARQTRGLLRRMAPTLEGRLADELIADRRAEAARE